jgi:uncharacterized metal-binding protein YceD (DUF177 family)
MRVHLFDLKPSKQLQILGTEPWLDKIYADFPATEPGSKERPHITGTLTLMLEESGSVLVTGHIDFAPVVSCTRCDLGIAWPLHFDLTTRFLTDPVNEDATRERLLTTAELDAYYLEADEVDLEQLINDTVQTGIPAHILATTDDGANCRVCLADLTEPQAYGERDTGEASPFAALRGLKLPN